MKRSCAFCQHPERDGFEKDMLAGTLAAKELDKNMSWRANTSDRHFRNHMGEYHMASNPSCDVCCYDRRADVEARYFQDGSSIDDIAGEIGVPEAAVYHHMKHHFQPLVKRSATTAVVVEVGREMEVMRNNASQLNEKLQELLERGDVYEEGFVQDAVRLHKEVRETMKDLMKFQDQWVGEPEAQTVNQTINVLKVELGKESPEVWKRVRGKLIDQMDGEVLEG